jgi:flagellar protein FliJ
MKHRQAQFESVNTWREAAQTRGLIADLNRLVEILNFDIAAEEQQARISDRSHREYPMFARNLVARRDNLLGTIAALQQRLSARELA